MTRNALAGMTRPRLRRWLALFFVALAVPTGLLVERAYSQLKWEAFHHHQQLAEELAARIDGSFRGLIDREEARSFTDYAFLNVSGTATANFLQRSPLAAYPVESDIPGLVGYYQVDAAGNLSTPLLPDDSADPARYGLPPTEYAARRKLQQRIGQILSDNRLVQADHDRAARRLDELSATMASGRPQTGGNASSLPGDEANAYLPMPAEEQSVGQAAFDQLSRSPTRGKLEQKEKKSRSAGNLGRIEDLKLDSRYQAQPLEKSTLETLPQQFARPEMRSARKEQSALPEPQAPLAEAPAASGMVSPRPVRIATFESEIDPFQFSLLDSGHFVLFRKVWRDGQRYIQGALIEQQPFLRGVVEPAFRETALSRMSNLALAYRGEVFAAYAGSSPGLYLSRAEQLTGALLYQTHLSAPLDEMQLLFSITSLPAGPGAKVIAWLALVLTLALCGGFLLLYRLGTRQIDLARQQQDFVSAVSHELKTPLTSIRMYGEMLREGWVTEEKKRGYYDYIYAESERLSRLINNVLQLARMTRNDLQVELQTLSVDTLLETVRSKVASQVERSGFGLVVECEPEIGARLLEIDPDYFTQIVINLVDNALKFSAKAKRRQIDIGCRHRAGKLVFSVRDYGPGIPRNQMRKIFRLFYRAENELTRETVGTGIGLALVSQLAMAMNGRVDVHDAEPGAEFRVAFPDRLES